LDKIIKIKHKADRIYSLYCKTRVHICLSVSVQTSCSQGGDCHRSPAL